MLKFINLCLFEEAKDEPVSIPKKFEGVSKEAYEAVLAEQKAKDDETHEELEEDNDAGSETEADDSHKESSDAGQQLDTTDTVEDAEMTNNKLDKADDEAETGNVKNQTVPYTRFNEVVEERNNARNQLAQLEAAQKQWEQQRQQYELQQQQLQLQQMQAMQNPQRPVRTAESQRKQFEEISSIAEQAALKRLGITKDELENAEYEDNSSLKKAYEAAYQGELANFYNEVQKYQMQQEAQYRAQQQQQLQQVQAQQVRNNGYNQYAAQVQARGDFNELWKHAQQKLKTLPSDMQNVILGAFNRADSMQGSDADIALVRQYIDGCVADMDANVQAQQAKTKQAIQQPKSRQVHSSSGDPTLTVEGLTDMVNNTPWEQIPQNIKDKLLRGKM